MSRVDELKRVGDLTMTDLMRLGKVAIGPGFSDRMRDAFNGDARNGGALVLVADADDDILGLLRIVLEEEGHEVIEAADGEQAAMLTLEQRPDLCVLDAMMAGLDGFGVTRLLRAADQTRTVPIILLSTSPQQQNIERAHEAGASDYLTKPFIPDELMLSVRELLD